MHLRTASSISFRVWESQLPSKLTVRLILSFSAGAD